mmetsp:Transcript_62081/g.102471  ORF Transcript_62081/g.102471 Transcript_62081/m.102471 type:complete len:203 (-) Transcript_62081:2355-2963(-)
MQRHTAVTCTPQALSCSTHRRRLPQRSRLVAWRDRVRWGTDAAGRRHCRADDRVWCTSLTVPETHGRTAVSAAKSWTNHCIYAPSMQHGWKTGSHEGWKTTWYRAFSCSGCFEGSWPLYNSLQPLKRLPGLGLLRWEEVSATWCGVFTCFGRPERNPHSLQSGGPNRPVCPFTQQLATCPLPSGWTIVDLQTPQTHPTTCSQ